MASSRSAATRQKRAAHSPEIAHQGGSGNGLAHSYAAEGKTTRKRGKHTVNGDNEGQLLVKTRRLSEKAGLWTTHEDVLVDGKTIKVTITKESSVAQDWIEQQTGTCFGLDVEWEPNRRKGQPENKVALMQISSETECLLIQMLFLDSIPSALVQFLKDPERKIIGVGINGDTRKLHRDFGLVCGGEVELTTLAVARMKNRDLKGAGLKILAQRVLGFQMNKSKAVTLSNWATSHLDTDQIKYACIDAWVSHAIFSRLQESRSTQLRW